MDDSKADMVLTDPPYGMNLNTDWSKLKGSLNAIAKTKGGCYKKVIGDDVYYDPSFLLDYFKSVKEIFLFGGDYFCKNLPDNGAWMVWDKRKPNGQEKAIGSSFEIIWSKHKHKKDILRFDWFGFLSSKDPVEAKNRMHPTQKPTSLLCELLNRFSKDKSMIADIYLGSGSTLIACEKTNRKCYGMEIDPHYCDVIVKRWEEFTGNKAERVERAES